MTSFRSKTQLYNYYNYYKDDKGISISSRHRRYVYLLFWRQITTYTQRRLFHSFAEATGEVYPTEFSVLV